MNFKAFFTREVDIRLTKDLNGFVCTARRFLFRKESTTVFLDSNGLRLAEPISRGDRRTRSYRLVLRLQPEDPRL